MKMEWEDECETEVIAGGPFGDTEPVDLGFETELVDELGDFEESALECGAGRDLEEEVVLDSEDEMIDGTEPVDDVKASFCAGIDGGVCADAGMSKNEEFAVIPADGCYAGEIGQLQVPGNNKDSLRPSYVGSHEPDELSEENALNLVEDFLMFNNLNLSPEVHHAKTFKENSFPHVKGITDVAKRISSSSSNQGTGMFDWVDIPDNVKHSDTVESQRKRIDASTSHSEFVDHHSESVRYVPEEHREKANHEYIADVNQHLNGEIPEQLLSSPLMGGEVAEAFDVGLCTQMAAEAMEALSHAASSSSPFFYQDPQSAYSRYPKDDRHSEACLNKSPQKVYARSCSKQRLLPRKRRGTAASSPKHPKRQKRDAKLVTQKKVKSERSLVEKSTVGESISRCRRVLGSSTETMRQSRDVGPLKTLTRKEVDNYAGVALPPTNVYSRQRWSQIRQSTSKMVKSTPYYDKFSSGGIKQINVIRDASKAAKDGKVNKQGQIDLKIDLLGFLLELGTCKYPRGKRTRRNSRRIHNGDVNLHNFIIPKQNRSNSRTFLSSTNVSFSDSCESSKVHQFAWNNSHLPSENQEEGDLTMQKSLSKSVMMKELIRLGITESLPDPPWKDLRLRKRRHTTLVRVLFSLHLDHDKIMQQKKILKRLGISAATSSEDATHFVADRFARTRNMLEAIACGKPVITPFWLESCAQAGCLIDERKFILKDARKEKELGFNMAASLANARQHPILKGRKVFITQQVKPSKEMLTSLIKTVHGQVIERNRIPTTADGTISDEVLIISCEEDQPVSAPLLSKGAMVCSSELILSGVVTQKLDYERHKLFEGNV